MGFHPSGKHKLPRRRRRVSSSRLKDYYCCRCLGRSRSPSSSDDDSLAIGIAAIDSNKRLIILEMQKRAKTSKFGLKCCAATESLDCLLSLKNGEYSSIDDDEEDDEYFSARSCFSGCSSWGAVDRISYSLFPKELERCEGWPFGLFCKKVFPGPPLPLSPSDSWKWCNNVKLAANKFLLL